LARSPGVSGQTRSFNSAGTLAIQATLLGGSEMILTATLNGSSPTLVERAITGGPAPGGSKWQHLCEPAIADDGTLAFRGAVGRNFAQTKMGIFTVPEGGTALAIATAGTDAPDVDGGSFEDFGTPVIVQSGRLAFAATLRRGKGIKASNDSG